MKSFYRTTLVAAVCAAMLSSCEKKTTDLDKAETKNTGIITERVFPLDGNEMSLNILPKKDLPAAVLTNYNNVKVKVIDSVCDEYVRGTTKLDLSKLKDDEFTYDIQDKKITVSSTTGFKKLNNGPKGWWTHWNYSPYTESEYPNVLFSEGEDGYVSNVLVLNFNKKVTTFGFEVAPNATGVDLNVSVGYEKEDSRLENELFSVNQKVSSPSGARLIAVKSETPFKKVTIVLDSYKPELQGLAISNIRYALAK
jgi:hypothetical protein